MSLLDMSKSASVLIVAIICVRALAINKLPKQTFVALWAVAVCRLLIPFDIASPLSIQSLTRFITGSPQAVSQTQEVYIPATNVALNTASVAAQSLSTAPDALAMTPQNTVSVLWIVWIVGAALPGVAFTVAYLRCRREFAASLPVEDEAIAQWLRKSTLRRKLAVRQSDRISSPLTYGILRPVILLPKAYMHLDERQLEYVLSHEMTHIRRFDAAKKLVLTLTLCVHWMNPLVWALYILANRDIELACDEAVVGAIGETLKSSYAKALVNMEEKRGTLIPLYNHFSKNAIEERIYAIMKTKKTTLLSKTLALVVVVSLTVVFATSATAQGLAATTPAPVEAPAAAQETAVTAATSVEVVAAVSTDGAIEVQVKIDDEGVLRFSVDGGRSWLTIDEYRAAYTVEAEYYTYEEYKEWIEQEKTALEALVGTGVKGWNETDGWFEWTQEKVDAAIAEYESTLEDILSGAQVSKPSGAESARFSIFYPSRGEIIEAAQSMRDVTVTVVEAGRDAVSMASEALQDTREALEETAKAVEDSVKTVRDKMKENGRKTVAKTMPATAPESQEADVKTDNAVPSVEVGTDAAFTGQMSVTSSSGGFYSATITLGEKVTATIGPFDSMEALEAAVRDYCQAQVTAGLMTDEEAEALLLMFEQPSNG